MFFERNNDNGKKIVFMKKYLNVIILDSEVEASVYAARFLSYH